MRSTLLLSLAGLLLATPSGFARKQPKSIPWVDTGPFEHVDGSGRHRNTFERLKHRRNPARAATVLSAASTDVGDVAVIVDNGAIIIQPRPAKPIDLTLPTDLRFTPVSGGFAAAFASASLDSMTGAPLLLGDDDTAAIGLPFSFPFLGISYPTIFVNSDGNITFGAGDSASTPRDAARLIGGPPRAAALLNDLDVTAGGSIKADIRADRVVVTWTAVPEFGASNSNTFQIKLFSSGAIHFTYQNLAAQTGVIGLAEGNDEGPSNEIDLTTQLPAAFSAGAIFEEFTPAILTKQIDPIALAQKFYHAHPDKFDFLVYFTDFVADIGFGAFAYHLSVKNQTLGLGLPSFDFTAEVGSSGELESILNMNRIGLYWPDAQKLENPPIKKFRFSGAASAGGPPGADQISRRARWFGTLNGDFGFYGAYTLGLDSAMSIMGQEAGHRWLAFVPFYHPTKGLSFDSFDLLGRDFSHWSFFFNVQVPAGQFPGDPRASSAEGNAILDLGPGAFGFCTAAGERAFLTQPDELVDGYTKLDQYLMGLRLAADVGPFWYADEPRSAFTGASLEFARSFAAQDDVFFCGKRVNLSVANIQAVPGVGPRVPALGDENDDGLGNDVKTMAFILLVEQGQPASPAHAAAIRQVDAFRRTWQRYANGAATGGRARFDTSLNPAVYEGPVMK